MREILSTMKSFAGLVVLGLVALASVNTAAPTELANGTLLTTQPPALKDKLAALEHHKTDGSKKWAKNADGKWEWKQVESASTTAKVLDVMDLEVTTAATTAHAHAASAASTAPSTAAAPTTHRSSTIAKTTSTQAAVTTAALTTAAPAIKLATAASTTIAATVSATDKATSTSASTIASTPTTTTSTTTVPSTTTTGTTSTTTSTTTASTTAAATSSATAASTASLSTTAGAGDVVSSLAERLILAENKLDVSQNQQPKAESQSQRDIVNRVVNLVNNDQADNNTLPSGAQVFNSMAELAGSDLQVGQNLHVSAIVPEKNTIVLSVQNLTAFQNELAQHDSKADVQAPKSASAVRAEALQQARERVIERRRKLMEEALRNRQASASAKSPAASPATATNHDALKFKADERLKALPEKLNRRRRPLVRVPVTGLHAHANGLNATHELNETLLELLHHKRPHGISHVGNGNALQRPVEAATAENSTHPLLGKRPLRGAKRPLHLAKRPAAVAKHPLPAAKHPLHAAKNPLHAAKNPLHAAKRPLHAAKRPLHLFGNHRQPSSFARPLVRPSSNQENAPLAQNNTAQPKPVVKEEIVIHETVAPADEMIVEETPNIQPGIQGAETTGLKPLISKDRPNQIIESAIGVAGLIPSAEALSHFGGLKRNPMAASNFAQSEIHPPRPAGQISRAKLSNPLHAGATGITAKDLGNAPTLLNALANRALGLFGGMGGGGMNFGNMPQFSFGNSLQNFGAALQSHHDIGLAKMSG